MRDLRKKVLIIAGPTASGKTCLSIKTAQKLQGQIISADSRQVFRMMNIGTAKPSKDEMRLVPHHFIDIRGPDELFTAGEYGQLARKKIISLLESGIKPIIAGGSGLYIHAVIHGIFVGKYADERLRVKLEKTAKDKGIEFLYGKLKTLDLKSAERIHINDKKRIIRALEVIELSGMPMSHIQLTQTEKAPFEYVMIGLNWPRNVLYERINNRVDQMIKAGLVKEVQGLLNAGYTCEHNAMDSVGYSEIISYLEGETDFETAVEKIKRNTRRFAKRQMTWFRREKDMRWLDCGNDIHFNELAERTLAIFYEDQ